jgi:DNA invertase Pin-like site-specific DNA recombinase
MLIGYARVSTNDQETSLQLDAFGAAGVSVIFQEKASGVGKRPQMHRAIKALKPGDTLVVWKIDRLARSLSDLLQLLVDIKARGASFRSLTEPIDTSSAMGTFVLQILGAVAQLERSIIRERVMAGQAAAMARGKRWGPPRTLSAETESRLVRLYLSGGYTYIAIAQKFGVTPSVARCAVMRVTTPLAYYTPRRANCR